MTRRLLHFVTALSVLMCVVACVLWAGLAGRSQVLVRHEFGGCGARIEVSRGNLYVGNEVMGAARYVYPQIFAEHEFAGFACGRSTLGTWVGVPLWFVALGTALAGFASWRVGRRAPKPGLCPSCGYDLRATPERCPECGFAVQR